MNKAAVIHRVSDNYCYAYNEDLLVINIQTGYDVKKVFLIYNDPFVDKIGDTSKRKENTRIEYLQSKKLKDRLFWSITISPEYKRCKYYFEIQAQDGQFYLFSNGLFDENANIHNYIRDNCFCFPWMNSIDINKAPSWVKDIIWYQIYPDRFCNGNSLINPENVKPWVGPNIEVNGSDIYGGDIKGIESSLEYLKDLGISGIYLTPINKAKSAHKYNTMDYLSIDEQFGDSNDLKNMVEKAHSLGIKIMLDAVFNHCGEDFDKWKDVVENGFSSRYINWFMVNEWPFRERGQNAINHVYNTFSFSDKMPKFNTNNPEVIEYLICICEKWIDDYDIDGIRLDVANETSHMFLRELRKRLKKKKNDIYILGESWDDAIPWLRGDEFDSVMNYTLRNAIVEFWACPNKDKLTFEQSINNCLTLYMKQTNEALFNIIDTHDTVRTMSRVNNIDMYYQQIAFLMMMPGSVCIYYGSEVAMYGGSDPDCRRCMPWNEIANGDYDEIIYNIKELIKIRKNCKETSNSEYEFADNYSNERIIELVKYSELDSNVERTKVTLLLNCSKQDIVINIGDKILFSNKLTDNILKPNGTVIFK